MSPRVPIGHAALADFCRRWRVTEFSLFGSVLRDDFRPDSDLDVLVTFAADARWSRLDLVTMQEDLRQLFGREVHLVEQAGPAQSVPPSRDPRPQRGDLCGLRSEPPPTCEACVDAAQTLQAMAVGLSEATYLADRKTQLAVERAIEILCEAARRVSPSFQQAHPAEASGVGIV